MFRKIYLTAAVVFISLVAFAQTGTLQGVITDAITGEPIPFANVVLTKSGNQTAGTTTDFDGKYSIKPIDPGTYNIKATFVGFQTKEITGVIISADQIRFVDIKLQEGVQLEVAEVVVWTKPLLDQGNLSGETKTAEEIVALPTRSVTSVAATTAGIYQKDEGDDVNIRGSRSDATEYYIDGIKVRGAMGIPTSGIEQIKVVTGGVPAQYGDATGGVISVTTKGPSNKFFGQVELESSSLFDKYNYNLLGFALSGPIIKKRNSDGTKGSSILGYFVAGELRSVDDTDPSAIGVWKVKDEILDSDFSTTIPIPTGVPNVFDEVPLLVEGGLRGTPFILDPKTGQGFVSTSNYLKPYHFENVQAKLNANQKRLNISGKLDFKPGKNTYFTLGGSFYARSSRDFSGWRSLLSWEDNRKSTQNTYRLFGKFTQKFGSAESNEENSSAVIKNAYVTLQGDYTNNKYTYIDSEHEFNLFNYGYVGRFDTYTQKVYNRGDVLDTNSGIWYSNVQVHNGWQDTLMEFTASDLNPSLVNYTTGFYNIFSEYGQASYVGTSNDGVIRTAADLQGQGLLNGQSPASVYSLYGNHGTVYGGAYKQENTQTTFKATGSADIKSHELSFGFEFEQRSDYYWGSTPMNLWGLADQWANYHIKQLDLSRPIPIEDENGIFQDTIEYNRLVDWGSQSTFDRNFRNSLQAAGAQDIYGRPIDSLSFLDIQSYSPSDLDIEMFSPDELLNSGSSLIYYYGYDIYGNKQTGLKPTLADFFTANDDGTYSRLIAPFEPIYTAGYIQDKFAIDDLVFNIGLRIDRYDANQMVLKDRYLLYDTYTAGTDQGIAASGGSLPAGIENDYYVYVDDFNSLGPTAVGYRNGDNWYNEQGTQISDPTTLIDAAGGKIAPYLKNPTQATDGAYTVDEMKGAFVDYKPEVVFMPRIAFSFPISDEAQFFAHYDVLTQRPPTANRLEPVDYLFMADRVGATLNNPDLKPEKTIDYELGFAKTLSLSSALKISAFYKEMRDMVQRVNTLGAYPAQYYTSGNIDFGTVKGVSVNYDLRRTNNVSLTANYTIQFADGTGSSASSGASLINTGQPNLRTTIPLSYDQRHALMASVDYRYGTGKKYNGPIWFGKKVFQDAGLNMIMSAGSGTPYSRQANITQEATSGISQRSTLEGSLNGSRLPWQFRLSAKMNKNFVIKWTDKKRSNLNVYVQVQNLLDAKNIISVYRATGNPDDDGYLGADASNGSLNSKNSRDSFEYLYSLAVNNPSNYSLPRTWRAGLSIDF